MEKNVNYNMSDAWEGFVCGVWQDEINVRDFIQQNYKEYTDDDEVTIVISDLTRFWMRMSSKMRIMWQKEWCLARELWQMCQPIRR